MAGPIAHLFEGKHLSLAEIARACPAYSLPTIRRWLAQGARSREEFVALELAGAAARKRASKRQGRNPWSRPHVQPRGTLRPFWGGA